jgi:hypothetical protein
VDLHAALGEVSSLARGADQGDDVGGGHTASHQFGDGQAPEVA